MLLSTSKLNQLRLKNKHSLFDFQVFNALLEKLVQHVKTSSIIGQTQVPILLLTLQHFFRVNTDAGLNTITFSTSDSMRITARFQAAPYGARFDRQVEGKTLTLQSPSSGEWWIELVSTETRASSTGFSSTACSNGTAGTNCQANVHAFNDSLTYLKPTFNVSDITYYSVVGPLDSLIFSARTIVAAEGKQPRLWAGWNRAPQFVGGAVVAGTFDISGCNVETCTVLTQLNLRGGMGAEAVNGTWYVAVQAQESGEHLVWTQYICPNNCTSGHGTCQVSGEKYGVCDCQPTFSADLLCSDANFLVEYIILIVIAALVAISAIIGLVAWAYMKSKHRGYEPV